VRPILWRNRLPSGGVAVYEFWQVVGPPPETTDQELVERARRGSAGAYDEIVQRYTEMAFRTAYLVTGSAADAEEAVQDGFVKAHRALGRFRAGASFRPWLLRIVGNEARNRRRAAGRRAVVELRAARLEVPGAGPDPSQAAEAAADRRALLTALEALPDEQRLVVTCRYLLQLSVEETAAALAVPEGTVKSRLARALDRLRELLEERADG
jgi:RNA polymerase sigma factor (sigma-70 family)